MNYRSVGVVFGFLAFVLLLWFLISGVWPAFGNVSSTSMEPHLSSGESVLVVEPGRYTGADSGVVTAREGEQIGYKRFGDYGDVILYRPSTAIGNRYLVIHRAMLYSEKGENWVSQANKSYLPQGEKSCEEIQSCPMPYDGYITKGDNNSFYDQVSGISRPVKEEWIVGVAYTTIPLQEIRLILVFVIISLGAHYVYEYYTKDEEDMDEDEDYSSGGNLNEKDSLDSDDSESN